MCAELLVRDRRVGNQFPGHFVVCLMFIFNGIFLLVTDERKTEWDQISHWRGWSLIVSAVAFSLGILLRNDWHGNPLHDMLRWGRHVWFSVLLIENGAILVWASRRHWREMAIVTEGIMILAWANEPLWM